MPTILLIRHGDNDLVGKVLAGRTPGVHLNEYGKQQAENLALSLEGAPIEAIYSSPLERSVETAVPLAESLGQKVQILDGLTEIDFGKWQGKPLDKLVHLKLWKELQEDPSGVRFPEGEMYLEAQQRIVNTIEKVRRELTDNQIVACFSHSDTIRLAVVYYLAMPINDFRRIAIEPASITTLILGKGLPLIGNMNQVLRFSFVPAEKKLRHRV